MRASSSASKPSIAGLAGLLLLLAAAALSAQEAPSPGEKPQNLSLPVKEVDLPEPSNDPKAIEVIDRYLKALGGQDTLKAITDKTVVFETLKHAPTGETKAVLKLFLKDGVKIREEWDLPGFQIATEKLRFVQVYDGLDGWVQMFGTISPLEGRTLSIFVWDKPIDDFFCRWKEDGYAVAYVNEDVVDGVKVDIVQTTDFHGKSPVRYFFAKDSGLLLKKEWKDQDQKGMVTKSNLFLSYADIPFKNNPSKKIKMPLHQKIFVGEDLDTERKYIDVSVNTGLSDAIFAKPAGQEFTGGIGRGAKKGGVPPQQIFQQFQQAQGAAGGAAAVDGPQPAVEDSQPKPVAPAAGVPKPVQVPVPGAKSPHSEEAKKPAPPSPAPGTGATKKD
jgi:hypothetical protein